MNTVNIQLSVISNAKDLTKHKFDSAKQQEGTIDRCKPIIVQSITMSTVCNEDQFPLLE